MYRYFYCLNITAKVPPALPLEAGIGIYVILYFHVSPKEDIIMY